jgi:hypothetical protein
MPLLMFRGRTSVLMAVDWVKLRAGIATNLQFGIAEILRAILT